MIVREHPDTHLQIRIESFIFQHVVILSMPSDITAFLCFLGYIIMDEMNSHSLRTTIESLLDDCERKQDLVQELVASSNKLQ